MMNIGKIRLDGNLILAPMSFVTNLPVRLQCKKYGASLVYSEMIFSEAILHQNKKSLTRCLTCEEERPISIQLLGFDPDSLLSSANIITEIFRPEIIDINLGCPVHSVTRNKCGSALLKKPEIIREIVEKLSCSLQVPITVKMRILNDLDETLKISRIIEKAGASALAVHGRTQNQKYSGMSNLEFIKKIKEELTIPVIANGDISNAKTAKNVLEYTQCDGLMIGRAAIGNPYIFKQIRHYLDQGDVLPPQSRLERLNDFFEYETLCQNHDLLDPGDIRTKALWFTKGMTNIRSVRTELNKAKDIGSVLGIMEELKAESSL
jgi:tRNA-dihydrouridine synthase B